MSKEGSVKRLSEREIQMMKEMYMDYISIGKIANKLNISRSTVQYYVGNGWKAERDMNKAEMFAALSESKKVDLIAMTDLSLKIIHKAIIALSERNEPPTIQEAEKVKNIVDSFDKITRLDDGNPTDILSNQDKPISTSELKKKLSADPFFEDEEEKKDEKKNKFN